MVLQEGEPIPIGSKTPERQNYQPTLPSSACDTAQVVTFAMGCIREAQRMIGKIDPHLKHVEPYGYSTLVDIDSINEPAIFLKTDTRVEEFLYEADINWASPSGSVIEMLMHSTIANQVTIHQAQALATYTNDVSHRKPSKNSGRVITEGLVRMETAQKAVDKAVDYEMETREEANTIVGLENLPLFQAVFKTFHDDDSIPAAEYARVLHPVTTAIKNDDWESAYRLWAIAEEALETKTQSEQGVSPIASEPSKFEVLKRKMRNEEVRMNSQMFAGILLDEISLRNRIVPLARKLGITSNPVELLRILETVRDGAEQNRQLDQLLMINTSLLAPAQRAKAIQTLKRAWNAHPPSYQPLLIEAGQARLVTAIGKEVEEGKTKIVVVTEKRKIEQNGTILSEDETQTTENFSDILAQLVDSADLQTQELKQGKSQVVRSTNRQLISPDILFKSIQAAFRKAKASKTPPDFSPEEFVTAHLEEADIVIAEEQWKDPNSFFGKLRALR